MTTLTFIRRWTAMSGFALAVLGLHGAPASAQYPTRPISITVGFAAGGTSDVAARILGEHMSRTLKVPVVIENRTGAGGSVAASAVTRADPDGYSIFLSDPGAYAINPLIFPENAKYNSATDFTPIALVGQSPLVLVVPKDKPFKTLAELTAYLKANPDKSSYASSGVAGITQFGAELYMKRAGSLTALHIPYRGGAPMMEALLKSEADFGVAVLASAVPMIESGGVRALALAGPSATKTVADVKSFDALGLPNATASSWVIMMGPKGLPADVVTKLNAAINEAIGDATVRERLLKAGIETYPQATPAQTGDYLAKELANYKGYQGELGSRLK
jgi:tripartite-type tricarboxylate transporter receptor subunit TctC